MKAAPLKNRTFITVLGPNLPAKLANKGTLHVHAAGCADIQRKYSFRGVVEDAWTFSVLSRLEALAEIYPPGDFLYDLQDAEDRAGYLNDVWFAPCVKDLPLETPGSG